MILSLHYGSITHRIIKYLRHLFLNVNDIRDVTDHYSKICLLLEVAARTLGDVVRKLGEKVLPEIIPILEKGLESDRSDQRQVRI